MYRSVILLTSCLVASTYATNDLEFTAALSDFGAFANFVGDGASSTWDFFDRLFKSEGKRSGQTIMEGDYGPCHLLPLDLEEQYTEYRLLANVLNENLTVKGVPGMWANMIAVESGLTKLMGFCAAANKDAFAFALSPVFPPLRGYYVPYWIKPYFTGFGFSPKGKLRYQSPSDALVIYDGFQEVEFNPHGHFWMRGGFDISPPVASKTSTYHSPKTLSAKAINHLCVSVDLSIFGDVSNTDGDTSFFLVVEEIYFWFSIFPVLKLGSGYGGYRHSSDEDVQVCQPNGFFVSFTAEIDIPPLSDWAEKALGVKPAEANYRRDFGLLWNDGSDFPFTGVFYRMKLVLEIMGWSLGNVLIEVQFITPREMNRRRKVRQQQYGCLCEDGYDSDGICKDELSPVDKWALENVNSETTILHARYTSETVGIGYMVYLHDLVLVIAFDFSGNFHITIGADVSVLWVAGFSAYLTITDKKVSFDFTVRCAGMKARVTGDGDTEGYAIDHPTDNINGRDGLTLGTKSLLDTDMNVDINMDWGEIAKKIGRAVMKGLKAAGKFAKKVWDNFAKGVENTFNDIKKFFSPGGGLQKFANQVNGYFNDAARFAKNFVGTLANKIPGFKDLASAGRALKKGNFKGFASSMSNLWKSITCQTKNKKKKYIMSGGRYTYGDHGCKLQTYEYKHCCAFKKCKTRTKGRFEEESCMKRVMEAAADVEDLANKAGRIQTSLDNSKSNNKVFQAINDGDIDGEPTIDATSLKGLKSKGKKSFQLPYNCKSFNKNSGKQNNHRSKHNMNVELDLSSELNMQATITKAARAIKSATTSYIAGDDNKNSISNDRDNGDARMSERESPELSDAEQIEMTCKDHDALTSSKLRELGPDFVMWDPKCSIHDNYISSTFTGSENVADQCGAKIMKYRFSGYQKCGSTKMYAENEVQEILVTPVKPKFTKTVDDVTVKINGVFNKVTSSIKTSKTGIPTFEKGCNSLPATLSHKDSKVTVVEENKEWFFERTWTVADSSCKNLKRTFTQGVTIRKN